jgi:DNA repair protein RadD
MRLREYQQRAISDLRAAYSSGRRAPCLVLPTGAGKTVIAAEIVRLATAAGRKTLFLAHRRELVGQSVAKLSAAGIHDVRVITAGNDRGRSDAPVSVASIPTLTNWQAHMPAADLVIFDECHHTVAETWASLAARYSSSLLLGMTATPQRGDGKPLGDIFDVLVVGSTVAELTALGHLVPCRTIGPAEPLDAGEIAQTPAEAYARFSPNRRAVIFCRTLKHAQEVASQMPVPTEVIHGSLSGAARSGALERFRTGVTRALANVHVLTEGWDDPGAEVCILARSPECAGTYLQMVGRVLRPAPGKREALFIDLSGSFHRHGTPDMARSYSLDGDAITLSSDREPIRQCPSCGATVRAAECVGGVCPVCLATLPRKLVTAPTPVNVDLIDAGTQRPPRPMKPVFIASKYPGMCPACSSPIRVGDAIAWTKGQKPQHSACWAHSQMGAA